MTASIPRIAEPNALALLEQLGALVDDDTLREIAAADYGKDAAEHYVHIRRMKDDRVGPEGAWFPMEVLELIRWSEPDQPGWRPGSGGRRGHVMRAFCSAWIIRVAGEREQSDPGAGMETALQLVGSLDHLEVDLWKEAAGLFDWFRPNWSIKGNGDEDAMLGVVQLYCGLRSSAADADLIALCEWIAAREEAIGSSWQFDERWGLRAFHDDPNRRKWYALGGKLAGLDLAGRAPALREWVGLIGASLAED